MPRPLLLDDLTKSFLPSYTNSHPLYTSDNRDTLDSLIQCSQNRYDSSSGSNNLDFRNPSYQEIAGIEQNIFSTDPNFSDLGFSFPQMVDSFHHLKPLHATKMNMFKPYSELNSSQVESQNHESIMKNSSQFSMGVSVRDVFSQQSHPSLQAYESGLENILKPCNPAIQKTEDANPPPPTLDDIPNVLSTPKNGMQAKISIPLSSSVTSLQSSLSDASAHLYSNVDRNFSANSLLEKNKLILKLKNQLSGSEPIETQSSRGSGPIPGLPVGNTQSRKNHLKTNRTSGSRAVLVKRRPQRSWEDGDFSGIHSNSSTHQSAFKNGAFHPSEIIAVDDGFSRNSCEKRSKLILGGSSGIDISQHPFLLSSIKKRKLDNKTTVC